MTNAPFKEHEQRRAKTNLTWEKKTPALGVAASIAHCPGTELKQTQLTSLGLSFPIHKAVVVIIITIE